MSGLWGGLRRLLQRRRWEQDLDAELELHVSLRAQQLRDEGCDEVEALRGARLELGMREMHKDAARRAWGMHAVDAVQQSVLLAWRSLRRSPAYAATALVVLSVPLALALLLFALFSAYAWQTPPVERPERWLYLEGKTADARTIAYFSEGEAAALVTDPPAAVEGLYSHRPIAEVLTSDRDYRGLGEAVSDNYFALNGIPAASGRLWFGRGDARDRDTLILSARGRDKLFGVGAEPVGRRLDVAGKAFTVIGVAGREFEGLQQVGALYWMRAIDRPATAGYGGAESLTSEVSGFLREGASFDGVAAAWVDRAPSLSLARDTGARLTRIEARHRTGWLREADRAEAMLAGTPIALITLLILAVASANLTNLVLARFSARRHDLALRAALGCGRWRLFGDLLVECLILGLLAAAVAVVLVLGLMQPIHDAVFGLLAEMGFDLHKLHFGAGNVVFALALGLFAAVCFGALPAWWLTAPFAGGGRADPDAGALKRSEPKGLRGGLMTVQLAASVFLTIVAGLVVANARVTRDVQLGFQPEPMVALGGAVDGGVLARQLATLPNVVAVGATSNIPLMRPLPAVDVLQSGQSDRMRLRFVDAGWWDMLGLRTVAGRLFRQGESAAAGSAILSERAAAALWPGQSPLGRRLQLRTPEEESSPDVAREVEVVGVVPDVASSWLFGDPLGSVVYLPATVGSAEAPTLLLRLRESSMSA
ncbi:MAG: ABC transporter permease, partial [Xanthomonadales bacterium]|nr:ABC transporter permease [Xanthomonadales bacterium]